MRLRQTWFVLGVICLTVLAGCRPQKNEALRSAVVSLEQDDSEQAIAMANQALQQARTSGEKADALYIRARAYEKRVADSAGEMQANLQQARSSYVEALKHDPQRPLADYIRASLGKVAFYQDDFPTAIQQLWIAYNSVPSAELKAASLYHMAKAQQRSGQFREADASFTTVINHFGSTGWAKKAQESRGVSSFYLQLAVYENSSSYDAAARLVQQRGLKPVRFVDQQGRTLLRAGPYSSYAQAKQYRSKVTDAFPDAIVVP